MTVQLWADLLE